MKKREIGDLGRFLLGASWAVLFYFGCGGENSLPSSSPPVSCPNFDSNCGAASEDTGFIIINEGVQYTFGAVGETFVGDGQDTLILRETQFLYSSTHHFLPPPPTPSAILRRTYTLVVPSGLFEENISLVDSGSTLKEEVLDWETGEVLEERFTFENVTGTIHLTPFYVDGESSLWINHGRLNALFSDLDSTETREIRNGFVTTRLPE